MEYYTQKVEGWGQRLFNGIIIIFSMYFFLCSFLLIGFGCMLVLRVSIYFLGIDSIPLVSQNAFTAFFIFCIVCTWIYAIYSWIKLRDEKGRGVIVPEYDPPKDLSPMEAGYIYDETIDFRDMIAEIMYFAEQGHLHICRVYEQSNGKNTSSIDYKIIRTRISTKTLKPFQKFLLESLFRDVGDVVRLSTIISHIEEKFDGIREWVKDDVKEKKYFDFKYDFVNILIFTILSFSGLGGVVFEGVYYNAVFPWQKLYLCLGLLVITLPLGVLVFRSGFIIKKKKAVLVKEYMDGLKLYIEKAEKERLSFHNAPLKNASQFEKILPFAIVLGLEKTWTDLFEDATMDTYAWYSNEATDIPANAPIFFELHNLVN